MTFARAAAAGLRALLVVGLRDPITLAQVARAQAGWPPHRWAIWPMPKALRKRPAGAGDPWVIAARGRCCRPRAGPQRSSASDPRPPVPV